MLLNQEQYFQAIHSRDPRFDGRFFFGVNSTGVYCRPVCAAKAPKQENCLFFLNAAAAENAGFRPCLRCRPELTPGNASVDAVIRLVQKALSLIEDGFLSEASISKLARKLQVTDRYLRHIFHRELGVSPIRFAQTQRLLLARRLLIDTKQPITEIAFVAGFKSLRRFNVLFKNHYGLNPTNFRQTITVPESAESLVFELSYRSPLNWSSLLSFLNDHLVPRTEEIHDNIYRRIIHLHHENQWHIGWLAVKMLPDLAVLQVTLDIKLMPVIMPVIKRIKKAFDLTCNPNEIMSAMGVLAESFPVLRVPGAYDGFEIAVQSIISHQTPAKSMHETLEKFVMCFGELYPTPFPGVTHAFPSVMRIAEATVNELSILGITHANSKVIIALAQAIVNKQLVLTPDADVVSTLNQLRSLLNIDECLVQYIVMRALSWPDAFPFTNKNLMKILKIRSSATANKYVTSWKPWRSYAAMHIWSNLSGESQ